MSSVALIMLLRVSSFTIPSYLSLFYILIGTFCILPSPPSPPLFSVSGWLGLCGTHAVAIGGLGQCVAIHLALLDSSGGWRWSPGARRAREEPQGAPADEGEPVELGGHEQGSTKITMPWHRQRNHVEWDRCVPAIGHERTHSCRIKMAALHTNMRTPNWLSVPHFSIPRQKSCCWSCYRPELSKKAEREGERKTYLP